MTEAATVRTKVFRIPLTFLARLAVEEYLARFWWIIATTPVFGLLMLTIDNQAAQVLGMISVLWPVTIPARALGASWKSGKTFSRGVQMTVANGYAFFDSGHGKGVKLNLNSIHRVVSRHGYWILRLRRLVFVAVPQDAFESDEDRDLFLELTSARARRLRS